MNQPKGILAMIVLAQFCCTSLWFASNGVMGDLVLNFQLNQSAIGHLTSAVQFGFIFGTLVYAILTIADRFSPSKVFFISALLAALFNLGTTWENNTLISLVSMRFLTGFFLAGIYPVGMKIAADYFEKGLGKSLGFLVGALVLGTAFPHLLKSVGSTFPWKAVIYATSIFSLIGGLMMMFFVPNGPFRKVGQGLNRLAFFDVFKNAQFRSLAFGYFGHMWELYAFWAFVPVILKIYSSTQVDVQINIPLWSFLIIGIGGLACVLAGYLSQRFGTKRTAFISLLLSGTCCLISPLLLTTNSAFFFLVFLLFWGMVVIADSPLFSTLVAQNAPSEIKGTALTIVNCLGFSITIVSILLINSLIPLIDTQYLFLVLAVGPILGLLALKQKRD